MLVLSGRFAVCTQFSLNPELEHLLSHMPLSEPYSFPPPCDMGTLFLPDPCEERNVKSEPCPVAQTPTSLEISEGRPQVNCHPPGCASYSLGLEWTPLPASSWPGRPPAVRSVHLRSPGEGSRKEMIKAWCTKALGELLHTPERDQLGVLQSVFALPYPTMQAQTTPTTA